ncbi:SpaH/EbpB family LPXTG-anchored major pilin [Niallia sp. FSL R7-0271]|uniref:SpaH/EbpB family LPXTG-anchored major pilin n=1 Tax=Niallia sp. FSL R7-0271 TaxID=2921678 RepID=UPI0030F70780
MKKVMKLIFASLIITAIGLGGFTVDAASTIDPNKTGSITVHKLSMGEESITFPGTGVEGAIPDGTEPLPGAEFEIVQTHKLDEATGNIVALGNSDTAYTDTLVTNSEGIVLFDDLPLGRYEMKEISAPPGHAADTTTYQIDIPLVGEDGDLFYQNGELVYDVHIYPKNEPFSADKSQRPAGEGEYRAPEQNNPMSIAVGDSIDYKINANVPADIAGNVKDEQGNDIRKYKEASVIDILDSRLTYAENTGVLSIIRDGEAIDLVQGNDYSIVFDSGSNTLKAVMNADGMLKLAAGDQLEFSFSVKVNEQAINDIRPIENKGNIVLIIHDGTENTVDTNGVYTETQEGSIELNKVDSLKKEPLAGAKFQLYKALGEDEQAPDEAITIDGIVAVPLSAEQTTDGNGKINWRQLSIGTYFIVETEAPSGYNNLTEPIKVKVERESSATSELELHPTLQVENVKKGIIPQTGGIGTIIFTVIGLVLMIGAAFLLKNRKGDTA